MTFLGCVKYTSKWFVRGLGTVININLLLTCGQQLLITSGLNPCDGDVFFTTTTVKMTSFMNTSLTVSVKPEQLNQDHLLQGYCNRLHYTNHVYRLIHFKGPIHQI